MGADIVKHPEYDTVERTILDDEHELASRYGAHHVGVSKKVRQGEKLSDTCITFYVLKKGAPSAGEVVPKALPLAYKAASRERHIVTDVCEIVERPAAFSLRGGHVVVSADSERGTVGLVFRQGGHDLFLTNAHVVTDPGLPPGQVSLEQPGGVIVQGAVRRIDDLLAPEIQKRRRAGRSRGRLHRIGPLLRRRTRAQWLRRNRQQ